MGHGMLPCLWSKATADAKPCFGVWSSQRCVCRWRKRKDVNMVHHGNLKLQTQASSPKVYADAARSAGSRSSTSIRTCQIRSTRA